MRRMYSEQELTKIIKEVFDAEVESGVFDESIADYVDEYLVEHPVDITALNGKTITPAVVNATGSITAPSIVETMTGYSFIPQSPSDVEIENIYCGICKNGNKLTIVYAFNITAQSTYLGYKSLCQFGLPSSIGAKLVPVRIGSYDYVDFKVLKCAKTINSVVDATAYIAKNSNTNIQLSLNLDNLEQLEKYYVRFEATFLLSDNLISE